MNQRKRTAVVFAIFVTGTVLGSMLWPHIYLPFSNPGRVAGELASLQYNPSNNMVRFCCFVLAPTVLLWTVYLLARRRLARASAADIYRAETSECTSRATARYSLLLTCSMVGLSILFAVCIPTYHSWGLFDSFHEGESLGAAICYLHGQVPYQDTIVMHGMYETVLHPVLGFRLFGRSIGAVRTVQSATKIVVFVMMALVLIRLFRHRYGCALVTLTFIAALHWPRLHNWGQLAFGDAREWATSHTTGLTGVTYLTQRDLPTFAFLLVALMLYDQLRTHQRWIWLPYLTVTVLSSIASGAFSHSLDRGLDLSAGLVFVLTTSHIADSEKKMSAPISLLLAVVGYAAGIALLMHLLQGGLAEAVRYSFVEMPKYKGLTDGSVYPITRAPWFAVAVAFAASIYWLNLRLISTLGTRRRFFEDVRICVTAYHAEMLLLVLALLSFVTALNGPDWERLSYSTPILWILLCVLLWRYASRWLQPRNKPSHSHTYVLFFVTLALAVACIGRIQSSGLVVQNFPIHVRDEEFLSPDYQEAVRFLGQEVGDQADFVSLTNEAGWYYLLDRPCPTRFPIVYYAATDDYQSEVINDLQQKPVKYVLRRNVSSAQSIHGLPNETRLSSIYEFVDREFVPFKQFGDQEIWIRRSSPVRAPL